MVVVEIPCLQSADAQALPTLTVCTHGLSAYANWVEW